MREAVLHEPAFEVVDTLARVHDLEQRPAAHDGRVERAVERDLLLEVVGDVARAPTELDDVDELARGVEQSLDVAQVHPLVDDVRETFAAWLSRALRQVEEAVAKAGQ